jgi:hypothetical protein
MRTLLSPSLLAGFERLHAAEGTILLLTHSSIVNVSPVRMLLIVSTAFIERNFLKPRVK